jgi:hypothetical protein
MFQAANQLNETISAIVASHESKKERLQPFIIVVGNLIDSESFYLVISAKLKYHFNSFMSCFDACFKAFFVLNLEYPAYGYRFWLYIQRVIFGIETKYDKFSLIEAINNDINLILAN